MGNHKICSIFREQRVGGHGTENILSRCHDVYRPAAVTGPSPHFTLIIGGTHSDDIAIGKGGWEVGALFNQLVNAPTVVACCSHRWNVFCFQQVCKHIHLACI